MADESRALAEGDDREPARSAKTTTPSAQLVELVPAATPSSRYVLHVGAASVEFGDDFDAESLRRVVEVLRSC